MRAGSLLLCRFRRLNSDAQVYREPLLSNEPYYWPKLVSFLIIPSDTGPTFLKTDSFFNHGKNKLQRQLTCSGWRPSLKSVVHLCSNPQSSDQQTNNTKKPSSTINNPHCFTQINLVQNKMYPEARAVRASLGMKTVKAPVYTTIKTSNLAAPQASAR